MEMSTGIRTITDALASEMVRRAAARATEIGEPMSIAIVDRGGNLKAFMAMDGAKLLGARVAQDKAWSAVSWDKPTDEWWDFMKDDPILIEGVPRIRGLTVLGGGYPIHVDGEMVGGIGVSGGHYSKDSDVARAAFSAIPGYKGPGVGH